MLSLDVVSEGYYKGTMFCPQCGSTQSDDLKFCKSCGANLQALRQVMASRETEEDYDWSKSWATEMFMSRAEIDRVRGVTPEMKRRREIKAGIITVSAGLGLMILLFVLMNGIVATGRVSDAAAEILMRLWIVGVIPILVGAALIFNGMFVSERTSGDTRDAKQKQGADTNELAPPASAAYLSPGDSNEYASNIPFSVTDRTTRHLQKEPRDKDS